MLSPLTKYLFYINAATIVARLEYSQQAIFLFFSPVQIITFAPLQLVTYVS